MTNTIKMTQTGDNFAQVVQEIPTPTTIDEVPAALYAILDAWREFGAILDGDINKNPRNPIEALGAATAGGALGVLRMVVSPTIENLARAIDAKLLDDAEAAAAAWESGAGAPVAVQLPTLEVNENAAQIVEDAISGAIVAAPAQQVDPAPFDVVTAVQAAGIDEAIVVPTDDDDLDAWAKRVGYES